MGMKIGEGGAIWDKNGKKIAEIGTWHIDGNFETLLLIVPWVPAHIEIEYHDHNDTTAMRDKDDASILHLYVPSKYIDHVLTLHAAAGVHEFYISVRKKSEALSGEFCGK